MEKNRAYEEGEWRRVIHRKRKTTTKHSSRFREVGVTTFFVSNIPEEINSKQLWMECKNLGVLADVFIPNKKDKNGGRFAFVRFKEVKSVEAMEKALGNIKVAGAKLSANIARFDAMGNKIDKPKEEVMYNQRYGLHAAQRSRYTSGEKSFKDILLGSSNKMDKLIEVTASGDSMIMERCINRSLVGEALSADILQKLDQKLKMLTTEKYERRYLGGLKVLITFENKCKAETFLADSNMWNTTFSSLVLWNDQEIIMERVTWINIFGVPPHVWDTDVFLQIGCSLGTVIFLDNAEINDADLSRKQMGIVIKAGTPIPPTCVVKWKGKRFNVLMREANEEWIPEFLKDDIIDHPLNESRRPEKVTNDREDDKVSEQLTGKINGQGCKESFWNDDILGDDTPVNSVLEGNDAYSNNINSEGEVNVNPNNTRVDNRGPLLMDPTMEKEPSPIANISSTSPNSNETDPFGLNDLIFNWGKSTSKKRKRFRKSPAKSKVRDKAKKSMGDSDMVDTRKEKRLKTYRKVREDPLDSRNDRSNLSLDAVEPTIDKELQSISMDLNKTPIEHEKRDTWR